MKRALVSVDFDFFVREKVEWDWGHQETMLFLNPIWTFRYASTINIRRETDPKKYADFEPTEIVHRLWSKNLVQGRRYRVATAESHLSILEFCKGEAFDLVINLDAHHDMYHEPKDGKPDCGNLWVPLYDAMPKARHIHVYPKWQNGDLVTPPVRPIEQTPWPDLKIGNGYEVTRLFFCRSGCWVPPHLDPLFNSMVTQFGRGLAIRERVIDLEAIKKQKAQLAQFRREHHAGRQERAVHPGTEAGG